MMINCKYPYTVSRLTLPLDLATTISYKKSDYFGDRKTSDRVVGHNYFFMRTNGVTSSSCRKSAVIILDEVDFLQGNQNSVDLTTSGGVFLVYFTAHAHGYFQGHDYSTSNNSKMIQHRAILTMADQQKVVYDLSNGTIFNDLERPIPRFQGHASLCR